MIVSPGVDIRNIENTLCPWTEVFQNLCHLVLSSSVINTEERHTNTSRHSKHKAGLGLANNAVIQPSFNLACDLHDLF